MESDDLPRVRPLWRILLFGDLSVQVGGAVVDRFEHRKAAALLACLAFYPHRSHSRDALMEMLWPEEDPEVTRARFRQTLLHLRRALDAVGISSDDFLHADRTFVRLKPDCLSTDVAEFEAALATAAKQEVVSTRAETLRRAVLLVRSDLLPGFHEDWVENERRRLTESYLTALRRLSAAQTELGDRDGALETARKALAIDPLHEETHCDLMRLLAETGRAAESLRQYQELEQRLWKELRIAPSTTTQRLMEEIRARGIGKAARSAPPQGFPYERTELTMSHLSDAPTSESAFPQGHAGGTLPAALTPLFGREREIAWLTERLRPQSAGEKRRNRLVTLTGLGGSGKTRLALEVAHLLLPLYKDALWFVPVVEVTEADQLISALANAVCGPGAGLDALLNRLGRCATLLVVDNFEQIDQSGAAIVRKLLEQAPDLTCLLTSRRLLHIEGELDFAVAPLAVPTRSDSAETLLNCPSLQLFLDRAQYALPGFRLTETNREATALLCAHLEGIPLALELAAAWCAVLSPSQLLERYTQDFAALTSSRPDIPARHQSLNIVVESSLQALDPRLREFFLKLGVFQGGWTLAAAESVCEEPEAILLLAALKRCALIVAEERGSEIRFRMLETLRAFARRQLDAEAMTALRRRHAEFFTALAEQASPHLTGPDQIAWLHRIQADYENLRAAIDWAAQSETDREGTLRLGSALTPFWYIRRFHPEAGMWIRQDLLRSEGVAPHLQARALETAGFLAANLMETARAHAMLARGVELYREMGDTLGAARCLCTLGSVARDEGDLGSARAAVEEALPILQASADIRQVGRALSCLGLIAHAEQDDAEAETLMERAATMYRICGHKKGMAWCLCILGLVTQRRSLTVAQARYEEGLRMARALEDHELILHALCSLAELANIAGDLPRVLGHLREAAEAVKVTGIAALEAAVAVWQGDLEAEFAEDREARFCYTRALQISRRADLQDGIVSTLRSLARYEANCGRPSFAIRLLAAIEAWKDRFLNIPMSHRTRTYLDPASLREAIGSSAFEAEWAVGAAMSLETAATYAADLLGNPSE